MLAYWRALPRSTRQRLARSLGIGALLLFPWVDLAYNLQLLNAVTDAAVLGGIGNLPGAVLGGYTIGFLAAFSDQYISSTWTRAVVFAILILVLVFRPWGFLGQPPPERY